MKLESLLKTFPGYVGPKKEQGAQMGGAVFYSSTGLDTPAYQIQQPRADDNGLLIGVYNHTYLTPGRVSVYRRKMRDWVRQLAVDGGHGPMEAYIIGAPDSELVIATIETFRAADRAEGTLILWHERAGKLVQHGTPFKELVDFRASLANGGLHVLYDRFPDYMCVSTMGPRLKYELSINLRGNHIDVSRLCLTPWFEIMTELYGRVSKHQRAYARALFEHPAQLDDLDPDCGDVLGQQGDLELGTAWMRVREAVTWRIDFKRIGKVWKIVNVTEE